MDNHETLAPTCGQPAGMHEDRYCGPGCPAWNADAQIAAGTELAVPTPEPTDPSGTPLRLVSTAALTFALGYTATQPVRADRWGGVCAMVEELQGRPPENHGPADAWNELLASLPTEIAKQLSMLYSMQRAQRWAQTGRRG